MIISMLLFRKECGILISISLLTVVQDDIAAFIIKDWMILISISLLTVIQDDNDASI